MTYPPQQPSGPYPPGPPSYPGGGYPGGGYPGGFPPGPPLKKNTGLIIGIVAAVVVVLAALGITGFVAPGFFLSDDKDSDANKPSPTTPGGGDLNPPATRGGEALPVPGGSGPEDVEEVKWVAEEATRSINERDAELAKSVSCDPEGAGDLSQLPEDAYAEVTGEPNQTGSEEFRVPVNFSAGGQSNQDFLNLKKQDDRWCVLDD